MFGHLPFIGAAWVVGAVLVDGVVAVGATSGAAVVVVEAALAMAAPPPTRAPVTAMAVIADLRCRI